MICTHAGPFDGSLRCTLEEHPATPGGHRYESTSGVPDRHDKPGRGDGE